MKWNFVFCSLFSLHLFSQSDTIPAKLNLGIQVAGLAQIPFTTRELSSYRSFKNAPVLYGIDFYLQKKRHSFSLGVYNENQDTYYQDLFYAFAYSCAPYLKKNTEINIGIKILNQFFQENSGRFSEDTYDGINIFFGASFIKAFNRISIGAGLYNTAYTSFYFTRIRHQKAVLIFNSLQFSTDMLFELKVRFRLNKN